MQIDDALKQQIADAVHRTVAAIDPGSNGLWRCEVYAGIGARLLRIITGEYFYPVAGKTGILPAEVCPRPAELLHASGEPLNTAPSWADSVELHPDPLHAWIENLTTGEVVDFSVRPVLWGHRSPGGHIAGHVYNTVEDESRSLQEKYAGLSIVDDLARHAMASAAPAVFRCANGSSARLLERIYSAWPREASRLLSDYNTGKFDD